MRISIPAARRRGLFAWIAATSLAPLVLAQDAPSELERAVAQARTALAERDPAGAREAAAAAWRCAEQMPAEAIASDPAQTALWQLGAVAYYAGDLRVADAAWRVVLAHRERTLPADDAAILAVRTTVAVATKALGDLEGALALEEQILEVQQRKLADDHADLQMARQNLGGTRYMLGDVAGARALFEKVVEVRSRTLPEEHEHLLSARTNLATLMREQGDVRGALAIEQKVFEIRSRISPDDDPNLQIVRANLAQSKRALGDLRGALALEEKVLEVNERNLPADHTDVLAARSNLAMTKKELGDLRGALALEEPVLAARTNSLPEENPHLQAARQNLAITKKALGDFVGALELEERVLAVRTRAFPADHADVLTARQNLGMTKNALGDAWGAIALLEQVLEVRARTLPADSADLQMTRINLAEAKGGIGDHAAATALLESVVAARTAPDDPLARLARHDLAVTKQRTGDCAGSLAEYEKVFEECARTQSDDSMELQLARLGLGTAKYLIGQLREAQALGETTLATWSRTLPDDHPNLHAARRFVALTRQALGDVPGAVALWLDQARITQARLSSHALAPREIGALVPDELVWLGNLLSLLDACEAGARRDALAAALASLEALRGAELRAMRLRIEARAREPERAALLERELRASVDEVARLANETVVGAGEERAATVRARDERLGRAIEARAVIERELARIARGDAAVASPHTDDIAARLDARAVAVSIVEYEHLSIDAEQPSRSTDERRVVALVLDHAGAVTHVPLGSADAVRALVERVRGIASGALRGERPSDDDAPDAVLRRLRQAVLDPVLAVLPADTATLVLSLDESLQLVPLDAVPLACGELLGTKLRFVHVASLLDLLESQTASIGDAPSLVAFGGIDYDAGATAAIGAIGDAVTPPLGAMRGGAPDRFRELVDSDVEVRAITKAFAKTFEHGTAHEVLGRDAGKRALAELAPRATFLHLATHGYFAPESVKSTLDAAWSPLSRFEFGIQDRVSGLSPLALAGLALAGANLPPDALGHRDGIVTAEEIGALDLSRCFLATLSACDTSLGVRRAGQGFASLRAALQAAGARFVLATLWKVNDQAAMELMADFYGRMWRAGTEPRVALWEAKLALRAQGAPFRDWAGWVLTGR